MKLFLKAIALAAKDPKFQGNPRQELNRLIDVAESSGLTVWHDNFCFKSTFWDWGNRKSGTVNWGGYGSSYRPTNESYFKFQYPGDTATLGQYGSTGKLTARKGAKPLDAVKAIVLPEADADGAMQALLAKAGANPVFVADKGLKADAIVDLLTKKKCNFLLTADDLPKGLAEALDKAAESKKYVFTLPVGRLRPLLEKAPKAAGPRVVKPKAYADKDDAKAFSKLKALLGSQKFKEIDQAITLLPGLPGVCDKLLEGISLAKGITAWTNDANAWTANYNRPDRWADNDAKLPCDLTVLGETFRLAEIPRNDLFNTSEAKRYALFSVINAAPDDCAAAKSIREGLVALHWKDDRLPPLSNFKALRHLYLDGCNGHESIGGITSLVFASSGYKEGLMADWILPIKSLKRLDVSASIAGDDNDFLKKASFPMLEELVWPNFDKNSPAITTDTLRDVWFNRVDIPHSRLGELLRFPRFRAKQVTIRTTVGDGIWTVTDGEPKAPLEVLMKIVPVKDRGEVLPFKELASLKKLLRDDSPDTVLQGLKILRTASPATIDALLEKSTCQWGYNSEAELGGNTRLGGPFFDSLKRNDLGEAVRFNLLSLATPGCKPADDIRKVIKGIKLPRLVVPIDVSGFQGLQSLTLSIDPSLPSHELLVGLEKLPSLRKLELNLGEENQSYDSVLKKPIPLEIIPPDSVVEMSISFNFQEIKARLDFITVSPNLRELTVAGAGDFKNIAMLKGINPSKLEVVSFKSTYSENKVLSEDLTELAPFENLTSISGSLENLKSLRGISAFKKLKSLELDSESLEDISELAQLREFERLSLSSYADQKLSIGSLSEIASANHLNFGGHQVIDPQSLLKFMPSTELFLQGIDFLNQ